jgi:hypothetical protein
MQRRLPLESLLLLAILLAGTVARWGAVVTDAVTKLMERFTIGTKPHTAMGVTL